MTLSGSIRRGILGAHHPEKVFQQEGFEPQAWSRFAPVAEGLSLGYNAALYDDDLDIIAIQMQGIDPAFTGFAYEGVGMGLQARDLIPPRANRLPDFVAGPGGPHIYPVYVGAGLALARLRRDPAAHMKRLDPLLGGAILDGYGFHAGFFERRKYLFHARRPTHLPTAYRPLFDQGLGRALWFASGGVVLRATADLARFPADRHGDLWNGIGMACSYGGGADKTKMVQLRHIAAGYEDRLAWGAATAAWTRALAGNPATHTDLACETFGGFSSKEAARALEESRSLPSITADAAPIRAWRDHFTSAVTVKDRHLQTR